jgi:hypothetical protein
MSTETGAPPAVSSATEGTGPPQGGGGPGADARRPAVRRWLLLGGAVVLVALGAAVTADAYLYSVRTVQGVEDAADGLSAARSSLTRGRLPEEDRFAEAERELARVRDMVDGARPSFGLVGAIPFLGRPVVAARELLEASEAEATAATEAQDLLEELLGGPLAARESDRGQGPSPDEREALEACRELDGDAQRACKDDVRREFEESNTGPGQQSPIFADGAFDLARLESYVPRLESILGHLRDAEAAVLAVPTAPFVSKVGDVKADILAEVREARTLGENALTGLRFLPSLLGGDGPRRYLVAFGDLSYLRGAGGSTLAIALMTAEDGQIELSPAQQVFRFFDDQIDYDVPVPADNWYLQELPLTRRLGNSNWSPHFPSSASVMADLYETVATAEGIDALPLDGVIQVDAQALALMMRATGDVSVPLWPEPISANDVAQVAYVDSHLELSGEDRREFAADLVAETWERIGEPRDAGDLLASVVSLGRGLSQKNVQVWFAAEDEQALAARLQWGGEIRQDEGDYLYVAEDNLETDSLDFFARQELHHDVTIGANGALDIVTTVQMTVDLPEGPEYREPPISSPRGTTKKTMVNLYVPEQAELVDVLHDDARGRGTIEDVQIHVEQGRRVFTANLQAAPNEPSSLIFRYHVEGALVRILDGPAYRLTVQAQPRMVPDQLTLTLHLPEGMSVRGDPHRFVMSEDGLTATLETTVERDFTTQLLLSG